MSDEEPREQEAEALAASRERGRLLFARDCNFVRGAATLDSIPATELPEVAFVGRSNCGKSTLLNALTTRKTLARVSNTPGRTREINFFCLGDRLMLADLPGYGFAKVSKSQSEQWTALIFAYLQGRPTLRRVALLIDSRRGPMDNDIEVMTLLDRAAVSYQLVLTKIDKVSAKELAEVETRTQNESRRHGAAHPELVATSAVSGAGLAELRGMLAALAV